MAFEDEIKDRLNSNSKNSELKNASDNFMHQSILAKYSYNFNFLGRPIIQYPQDIVAVQEIIWKIKPDLIIETGIAHGGSLILSASILSLIDYCNAIETNNGVLDTNSTKSRVVGIDIDIREHNRKAIEEHPMSNRITMIEGSSISDETINTVKDIAKEYQKVLVMLDSNHTHEHVYKELEAYAPLTSVNSYCVVFDTIIEDLVDIPFNDRPWCVGDNPKTAVHEFLSKDSRFQIDSDMDNKLLISAAPNGYLKRIK